MTKLILAIAISFPIMCFSSTKVERDLFHFAMEKTSVYVESGELTNSQGVVAIYMVMTMLGVPFDYYCMDMDFEDLGTFCLAENHEKNGVVTGVAGYVAGKVVDVLIGACEEKRVELIREYREERFERLRDRVENDARGGRSA